MAERDWHALIPDCPTDWALIPLDGRKRPIDPSTGHLLEQWQRQDGYDVDGIAALNGSVQAVGIILGPKSSGVLAVDFDGPDSHSKFQEIYSRPHTDLPHTIGATSGRPSRQQRLFQVDQDWWPHLAGRKAWNGSNGKTCLELRWDGCQSVIAGAHPETSGYSWCPNSSPADCCLELAPDWLLEPLIRREDHLEPVEPSSADVERAVNMLAFINPLSRTSYEDWLQVGMALHHTDPGLLSAWVDWCKPMPNFNEQECLNKWQTFGNYNGNGLSIRSLHSWAKQGGYKEPKRTKTPGTSPTGNASSPTLPPIDEWDRLLKSLVNPEDPGFELNSVRRQIRALTAARDLGVVTTPNFVRATLTQHQRNLITGTETKGTRGGEKAKFKQKQFLINNLIPLRCLTGIAAFNKVGKTKLATELASSLIFQHPFMGNPEWMPAPPPDGGHKFILWWVDQPGADSSEYLKARNLMQPDGTLHPQIVALYTEDDDLSWDDQGLDLLIRLTAENPGAILITDSFFACIQRIHGTDQEPEAGGALIDVQTLLSQTETTHICLFHSPKETGPVGINAIRGHGSAGGAVSGVISLHFLEKKCPNTGKWVADKENPHRRMVFEGRGPYIDLLIKGDWAQGTFQVLGSFQQKLGELLSDSRKADAIQNLTSGQKETLEWVGTAIGFWKAKAGVSVIQVANASTHPRTASKSEVETTRRQLKTLHKLGLLSATKNGSVTRYDLRSQDC